MDLSELEDLYTPFGEDDEPDDEFNDYEPTQTWPKVGRNEPCPCGSGRKYKECCLNS